MYLLKEIHFLKIREMLVNQVNWSSIKVLCELSPKCIPHSGIEHLFPLLRIWSKPWSLEPFPSPLVGPSAAPSPCTSPSATREESHTHHPLARHPPLAFINLRVISKLFTVAYSVCVTWSFFVSKAPPVLSSFAPNTPSAGVVYYHLSPSARW